MTTKNFSKSIGLSVIAFAVVVSSFIASLAGPNAGAKQNAGARASQIFAGAKIRLDKNSRSPVEIRFRDGKGVPASSFFEEYKRAFGLSGDNEIKPFKVFTDRLGQTHRRCRQYYKGVELAEVQFLVHEKNGSVFYAHGNLIHGLALEVKPALSEPEALQYALAHVNAESYMWQNKGNESAIKKEQNNPKATFYPRSELKISAGKREMIKENFRLVYRFDIYTEKPLGRYDVDVDAKTGEVINTISRIQHGDVQGQGLSLYNGSVPIIVDSVNANQFRLREAGRGGGIETYDMRNDTSYSAAIDFVDSDANFSGSNARAGVSVHWGTEATYDYYLITHGRNSYDDAGSALRSYVHYGDDFNNAFWDGSRMTYGDGDGTRTFLPLVALDVVGHEITHGVTEFSAALIYQNESGAMNESFSDIFGAAVEYFKEGVNGDWLIGEDVVISGPALRSMGNPNSTGDPDTYFGRFWAPLSDNPNSSNDNGGVHTNSGVQNFWFYLLAEGGSGVNDNNETFSVTGIGLEQAAQLAYRNLTVYLMPRSRYFDARLASINSAIDMFGQNSPQYQAVLDAWFAVGVLRPFLVPTVGASADTVSFLAEVAAATDTAELTISNFGLDTLRVDAIQLSSAAFQILSAPALPVELGYDDDFTLRIVFAPTVEGEITETLNISSNDPANSTKSVFLRGKGFVIHPAAEGFIYAVTGRASNGVLLTLNQNSGSGTPVGAAGFAELTGVTIRPTNGELYGTVAGSASTMLVRINAQSGEAYERVVIPVPHLRAIAFDLNGDLYAARFTNGDLFRVNPATGDTTRIGSTRLNLLSGLAINPVDRTLWGTRVGNVIYKINKSTAEAGVVGNTGFSQTSEIEFDADGKLFGLSGFAPTAVNDLIRIDPATGKGTLIGSTNFRAVYGLAIKGTIITGVDEPADESLPTRYALHPNYPNPFNPSTVIRYDLPEAAKVVLKIYDLAGHEVKTLVNARQPAGYKLTVWNGQNERGQLVSSGVYVYKLHAGNHVQSKKMLFLK